MDVGIIIALIALAGSVVGGYITLRSGRPDAYKTLAETIDILSSQVAELQTKLAELEIENRVLSREASDLRARVAHLESENAELRIRVGTGPLKGKEQ